MERFQTDSWKLEMCLLQSELMSHLSWHDVWCGMCVCLRVREGGLVYGHVCTVLHTFHMKPTHYISDQ